MLQLFTKFLKRNIKLILIFIIIDFTILFSMNFLISMNKSITNNINNQINSIIENRAIVISSKQKLNKKELNVICKNTKCENVFSFFQSFTSFNDRVGQILFNKYYGQNLELLSGRYPNENSNEIIIPDKIKQNDKIIETNRMLGEKIDINISMENGVESHSFLVTGLYKTQNEYKVINDIYGSIINDNNNPELKYQYILILRDEKGITNASDILKNSEYEISYINDNYKRESNSYHRIKIYLNLFFILLIFSLIIIFILFSNYFVYSQTKNLALLSVVGFKDKVLFLFYFSTIFMINSGSLLLVYIFTNLLSKLIVKIFCKFILNLKLVFYGLQLFLITSFLLLICIVVKWLFVKRSLHKISFLENC